MKRKNQTQAPAELSPVFARAGALPRVQAPDSPWTVWVGVGGAALLGVLVFNGLSSGREAHAQTPAPPAPKAAPAPASPPPPPPAAPSPQSAAPLYAPAPAMPQPNPEEAHWRSPTVVVDFGGQAAAQTVQLAQADTAAAPGAGAAAQPPMSADERFAARLTGSLGDVARAGQMRDLGRMIPEGTVIAAVLETAINSDVPGSVRGVVSRDVRSFDGSRVLIPRGSKLIGEYKSAVAAGQSRAFVVWSRVISPAGVSIDIGSPATDRLGRGGLTGDVDRHFFQRFGAGILLTVLQAGTTALASNGDSSNTLIIGAPTSAVSVGQTALQQQVNIPDTIKVAQGVPVQVLVARDLDFSGVVR
ncbi:TrbI/VirB10 family protein [Phenylobacterium sp. VNQ135]|uniref:TrbI/VirB10 family protein n=1 Tax=Phenylobacterium sp. VNQ135 TaxID=3400922 RepID=UPI003C112689